MTTAAENRIVDVAVVAKPFLDDIKAFVDKEFPDGNSPKLVGILANEDPFAKMYAKWTRKACERVGLRYETIECKRTELEDKDVEGMCFTYIQALYRNQRVMKNDKGRNVKSILPCTPLACVKILEHLQVFDSKEGLAGKTITVINRSQIVGHPLAAMLANDGAEVYSKDIDSMFLFKKDSKGRGRLYETEKNFKDVLKESDVVISGVPSKGYKVPVEDLSNNTVFLNVSSHENVDKEELFQKKKGITYVPKVGKVTVAMLQRNLIRLYNGYHKKE
eukprot:jgi/Bigna1/85380/estExt_fgenesh1_pg.C_30403